MVGVHLEDLLASYVCIDGVRFFFNSSFSDRSAASMPGATSFSSTEGIR